MPAKSRVPRVASKPPASTATATATGMATSSSIVDQNSQTTPLFLPREGDHDPYDSENEMPPPPPPRPKISGSSPKASDFIEHPGMLRDQIEMLSDSEHCSDDDEPNYESDDDPVVREYDVYITSELAKSLYLFQYPVRPRQNPYTRVQNSCPLEARLKSKAGLVEVDVPVNVDVNFNEEKGRIWGDVLRKAQQAKESGFTGKPIGVRGGKRRKVKGQEDEDEDEDEDDVLFVDFNEAVKKGRVLNKQTLGSKVQPDEAKYMVGVFHSDQLHLTPVHSTLQLRPQFSHVDAQNAQERAQNKVLRDADEAEKPSQARAVHLTVNQEVTQMSSTMKALRTAEEDEWKKLHWVDQEDDDAWNQYEMLCLRDTDNVSRLKTGTGKSEYMDWLSGSMMSSRDGGGE